VAPRGLGWGYPVSRAAHLTKRHPLASVARQRCAGEHPRESVMFIGAVACGACWEQAIRADERFALEFDLSSEPPSGRDLTPDPVAVELAVRTARAGQRVRRLPLAERAELARMVRDGETPWVVAVQLGLSGAEVTRLASLADERSAEVAA
jgi:hypothetical protein